MSTSRNEFLKLIGLGLPPGGKMLGINLESVKQAGPIHPGTGERPPQPSPPAPAKAKKPTPARYTRPGEDGMNKLERRYSAHLAKLKAAGEIFDFAFQPEKFRLANKGDACYYTPDFRVLLNEGTVEFHETKGFMQEDALVKIKWFVSEHPYPLVVVRWIKGEWKTERYEP